MSQYMMLYISSLTTSYPVKIESRGWVIALNVAPSLPSVEIFLPKPLFAWVTTGPLVGHPWGLLGPWYSSGTRHSLLILFCRQIRL